MRGRGVGGGGGGGRRRWWKRMAGLSVGVNVSVVSEGRGQSMTEHGDSKTYSLTFRTGCSQNIVTHIYT